jgi:hypothetical protein
LPPYASFFVIADTMEIFMAPWLRTWSAGSQRIVNVRLTDTNIIRDADSSGDSNGIAAALMQRHEPRPRKAANLPHLD